MHVKDFEKENNFKSLNTELRLEPTNKKMPHASNWNMNGQYFERQTTQMHPVKDQL